VQAPAAQRTTDFLEEVGRYLSAPLVDESADFSLLGWWGEDGVKQFPRLAKLAAKILCGQGTSARSEGNFSSLKYYYTVLRARLAGERVQQGMLLYLNAHLVKGVSAVLKEDDRRAALTATRGAEVRQAVAARSVASATPGNPDGSDVTDAEVADAAMLAAGAADEPQAAAAEAAEFVCVED
jgi:hypothetical protein